MTKRQNIGSIPQHIQDAVVKKFKENLDCYTRNGGFMKSCYEDDDFFIEVTADVVIDKYDTWAMDTKLLTNLKRNITSKG